MKIINDNKLFLFLLMWFGVLINFNSHYNDMYKFYDIFFSKSGNLSITVFLNFIRSISIYIISIFIILFFSKSIFHKKNYILNLLFIYILIQLVAFVLNRDLVEELDQVYFWLNYFLILIFFYAINSIFNKDELRYFFVILMLFVALVVIILLTNMYIDVIKNKSNSFYYSYFVSPESRLMEQGVPRVTGIARTLLLLIICNSIILLNCKNKVFSFLILLFLSGSLFLTQARSSLIAFLLIGLFLCFFDKNYKIYKKLIVFITLILLCSTYQMIFPKLKGALKAYNKFIAKEEIVIEENKIIPSDKNCQKKWGFTECEQKIIKQNWEDHRNTYGSLEFKVRILEDFSSSGRVNDWKKIINLSKEKLIIGYGFQADRYLIKTSASSSYFYSLISSGILGLFLFAMVVFIIIFKYIKIVFIEKLFSKKGEVIYKTCFLINVFIILRTLIENSFAVYNFDLALFLFTFLYLNSHETIIKKNYS